MSNTIVQIRIIKDVPDEHVAAVKAELQTVVPSHGTSVAHPIADMPNAVWEQTEDSHAAANGWTETMPNPDYDPEQPAGPDNLETVPRPATGEGSKPWNVTSVWRERATLVNTNYQKRVSTQPVTAAVDSGINQAKAAINVADGDA